MTLCINKYTHLYYLTKKLLLVKKNQNYVTSLSHDIYYYKKF